MTKDEFKKIYNAAKVWADFDPLLEKTDLDLLRDLASSLELVKDYVGLDMRADFLLGNIKGYLRHHMI